MIYSIGGDIKGIEIEKLRKIFLSLNYNTSKNSIDDFIVVENIENDTSIRITQYQDAYLFRTEQDFSSEKEAIDFCMQLKSIYETSFLDYIIELEDESGKLIKSIRKWN